MHYFLYIQLAGFYCAALEESDPILKLRPLVVHRDKVVLDSNALAKEQNVWKGMPLSEAKAILQDAHFQSWEEESYRLLQERWLTLANQYSDVIEPDQQHSAWIDLSNQPDAEAMSFDLCQQISQTVGLRSRIGMAGTKWLAKLSCENRPLNGSKRISDQLSLREPCSDPASYLASLKTRQLTPVRSSSLERLEFLGYKTVGDVACIPLDVLRGQFGDESTHILSCARGKYFEQVKASFPPNSMGERFTFQGDVDDSLAVDRALQLIAAKLAERLRSEDLQSKDVLLQVDLEGEVLTARRRFTKAITNYPSAIASLRLLFNSLQVSQGISMIRVRLEKVEPLIRVQKGWHGRIDSFERSRGIASACDQVRSVFGDSAVVTGSEVKVPRRKLVLKAWKDATGWT